MKKVSVLMKWLWAICLTVAAQGVAAQAPFCDNFTSGINNWAGFNASPSHDVDATNSNGTGYMRGTDYNDASLIYNATDFIGAALPCGGRLCWRFKVIEDMDASQNINVTPSIRIYTGPVNNPTLFATFTATGITVNENSPWVSVCATVAQAVNGVLPAGWTMGNNGTAAQWNQLATSFTGVAFNTDLNPGPVIGETIGIDDFCINPNACCNTNASSNFSFTSKCVNDVWTVTVSAAAPVSPNNWWGLMETSQAGNTSEGATLNNGLPVQLVTGVFTATFTGLDPNKFYYIKHGIWDANCYAWREHRKAVERPSANYLISITDGSQAIGTVCYGNPIYMVALGAPDAESYTIGLLRRPANSPPNTPFVQYANYGPVNGPIPPFTTFNLGALFAGLPNPVYFEPGYEYSVRLRVSAAGNCYADTEAQDNITVVCCDDFFKSCFQLDPQPNPGQQSNALWARNFNTYWQTVGATHEWYVLSSPNPSGGPYTLVNTVTSTSQTDVLLYGNAQYGVQYKVIHKVKTKCGEYCCAQSDCANCRTSGIPNDVIDCRILDSVLCTSQPPKGLKASCLSQRFSWAAVPGAVGYSIEVSFNDPACCVTKRPVSGFLWNTLTTNNLPFSALGNTEYECIRWRVRAKCADGVFGPWSDYRCFYPCHIVAEEGGGEGGGGDPGDMGKRPGKAEAGPRIAPNPNNGNMTLSMEAPGDLVLSVDVFNAQGGRIKTIARNTYRGGQFVQKLNLGPAAGKGIYTVVFHTNYGTFRKKIIVQ
jgi:hypothetical protein